MTAISPYAPAGRNSFLVHHPEVLQRRSSRLRRRNSFAFGFLIFLVKFRDLPFVQNLIEKIKQSDFGRQLHRRGITVWKVVVKLIKSLYNQLYGGTFDRIVTFSRFFRQLDDSSGGANNNTDTFSSSSTTTTQGDIELGSRGSIPISTMKEDHITNHLQDEPEMMTSPSDTSVIYQNRQRIRQVLMYWFGQYSPDTSQKKLWMIASSSVEHRLKIDEEITTEFQSTMNDLVSSSPSSNNDSSLWKEWVFDNHEIYGYEGKVAAIIVLDQFSRHIRRHYENDSNNHNHNESSSCPIPNQSVLDKLALQTAEELTRRHTQEINCGMIPLPMYIFALMPYRHASTIESVKYVQHSIENLTSMEEQMNSMLQRFRKATNRRMNILQDEARRAGKKITGGGDGGDNDDNDQVVVAASSTSNGKDEEDSGYVTANSTASADENSDKLWVDDDILEVFPFNADMTTAMNHPVHSTIRSFLASQGIHPINASNSTKTKSSKQKGNPSHPNTTTAATSAAVPSSHGKEKKYPVIVSLSGGVDSMVIAAVLAHLVKDCNYNLRIVAIHLDYGNRPESGAEADYVRKFCLAHGIEFICRRIDEIKRDITARDDYERMSREIRYSTYRQTAQECLDEFVKAESGDDDDDSSNMKVGVMLGHHRGDLRENVLSNSHKGCGPLDLSGMTSVSMNDGVLIQRPLLSLEKDKIFDYSHKYGVPYFKDTTPHWSTRGKLRNKLLPLLQEIYGEGSMNNLSTLATESDEARELLHQTVLGPFLDQIQFKSMGITFDTAPWKDQGLFFWKFVLREALHKAGLGMFSDKSVISFLERVQAAKIREGWLQCRRDYAVYLGTNGRIYVFYPESFPFRKADQFTTCIGQAVSFGEENAVRVGPWKIMSEIMDSSQVQNEEIADSLLKQKAIQSMDKFMDGSIHYYTKIPKIVESEEGPCYRPLVFISEFTKGSRPMAWRKLDLRIQTILPLLGNDLEAVRLLEENNGGRMYGDDYSVVKVTMDNLRTGKNGKSSV